jgi:hypothetical protein
MKHWLAFRKSHPEMEPKEAMEAARKTYKRHDIMDKKHDAARDKEHKKANTSRRSKGKYGGAQADPLDGEASGTADAVNGAPTSAIKNTGHAVQLAATGATGASRKGKGAKTMKRAGAKKGKSRARKH